MRTESAIAERNRTGGPSLKKGAVVTKGRYLYILAPWTRVLHNTLSYLCGLEVGRSLTESWLYHYLDVTTSELHSLYYFPLTDVFRYTHTGDVVSNVVAVLNQS